MELRQIQYFLKICETLHFSKAAEALNISQQPLSFQIKKLEEELGFSLFKRTTRSVEITPAGKEFQKNVEKALFFINHGVETGKKISDGQIGKLKIGYNSLVLSTDVIHSINNFKKLYPEVEIVLEEFNSPDLENAVLDGIVDFGIVGLIWQSYEELYYQKIATEYACLAIPKTWDLAKSKSILVREIENSPFITYSRSKKSKSYHDFISTCHILGFDPHIIQTAESDLALLGLVGSGLGIALVPSCYKHIYNHLIVYKSLKGHTIPIELSLVWNKKVTQQKSQHFIDTLTNH
ncbi:LysR family transcriptional regulator [Enterococcus faecium]